MIHMIASVLPAEAAGSTAAIAKDLVQVELRRRLALIQVHIHLRIGNADTGVV